MTYTCDLVLNKIDINQNFILYQQFMDVSVDCIKIIDINGIVLHMNRAGCIALLGQPDANAFGLEWLKLLPAEVRGIGQQAINRARTGKTARFSGKSGQKKDTQYWDNLLTPMLNENGEIYQILCVSRNVTLQKLAESKLARISQTDELTGLNNRRTLKKYIRKILRHADKKQGKVGLMFIDLDHFKLINDTLGHAAGDYLLKTFAKRLACCEDKRIFVARLGGDEFALVIDQLKNKDELREIAGIVLKKMEKSIMYAGKYINGSISIGCAIYPDHAIHQADFIKAADSALNHLKITERGGFRIFNREIAIHIKDKAHQIENCRAIIRDGLIEAYYQPQVNLITGQIIGYEALLRWMDQSGCLQLPNSIFEAFQQYDLARKIGDVMLEHVLKDIKTWQKNHHKVLPVSINAAPIEFLRDDYAEHLIQKLEYYQISGDLIQIEITEQILSDRGAAYVLRALNVLKAYGVRIALDDFGIGHSSLIRLRDYPVDCLKLDASFIQSIGDDGKNFSIIRAITELGPSLSLKIIAEGVETEQQRQLLVQIGCQYGQGFLFSPAIHADQIYQ
ncbi:hypothetical protein BJI46_10065 [Acinetobacter qingfengensis]|uniref:Diguanylate cyclase n=1 Tax=Acinetobacter qingfengensis TaxID=1262585 RepID=A0A1E7RDL3_9GAMM|nr:hypothetical protein BJI46_10065 [Acinetobacter qingfengensis]